MGSIGFTFLGTSLILLMRQGVEKKEKKFKFFLYSLQRSLEDVSSVRVDCLRFRNINERNNKIRGKINVRHWPQTNQVLNARICNSCWRSTHVFYTWDNMACFASFLGNLCHSFVRSLCETRCKCVLMHLKSKSRVLRKCQHVCVRVCISLYVSFS